MKDEVLNLDFHILRRVIKALNAAKSKKEAAKCLGISIKTLNKYIVQFNLINNRWHVADKDL